MTELTQSVSLEKRGDIALVIVDNPPVNALSHHVRQGILDGMTAAQADDEVKAIVLTCRGRTFIAGADISEFGQAPQGAPLPEVQAAMESSTKPVVAAIHGTALGGGFEVAMCANYRVGVPSSRYGFPEVKLGLLPGAGGTQRLPRVVGAAKALDMVVGGDPIDASEALELGLIDAIADGDSAEAAEAAAVDFARRCIDEGLPLKKLRDLTDKITADRAHPEIFEQYRAKVARKTRGFQAPESNIRCIEAAVNLDDFDAGMARERELFTELVTGTQSAAQRYYFFAEREAAKVPDVPKDTPQLDIRTAGVLGAGTMGGGIAMNFANAGIPVVVVERDQESLDRGLGVVRSNYERSASRGSMPAEDVEKRMALITGSLDRGDFAELDIVIEAVFEDMELKKSVFAELDAICKPDALLASNTSALDVNVIASATGRPESVIGMHFFSPANVMKLLEVVRGDKTSNEIIATTMALSKRIAKIPVLSGVCHGFIGNRMLAQRRIEADQLVLEGATPAQVDQVIYDFGFPMGPYAMSDLAGLDIGWKAETSTSSTVREIMCESGRRGQKNGKGYYTYDPETRAATPDPEVVEMIRTFAKGKGIEQREVTDAEVLDRCLLPMVNEGCKILDEGIAIRASDIDVVWINGYGWPVYTGGPMFWADTVGLETVVDKIRSYHERLGGRHWEPAARWETQLASGKPLHTATA